MNAAFVIVASALLGNHPAAASCNTPACAPAPAAACSTCDTCAGPSFGHRLRGHLNGLFSCNTCKKEDPCPAPCPAPAPACDPCKSHGHGFGNGHLLGKLRGMFSHGNSCDCAPACDAGCSSAPAAAPAPAGEAAPAKEAPKKMPDAPKGAAPKGDKAVQFVPTPEAPLAIPAANPVVIDNRPNVIAAPATLRNPF